MFPFLQALFDACYLVFESAVTTVTVFIEMGCCDSKEPASKNPTEVAVNSESVDVINESAGHTLDEDDKSTDTSIVSNSSEDSFSHETPGKNASISFSPWQNVTTKPLWTSDVRTLSKEVEPSNSPNDSYPPALNTHDFSKEDKTLLFFQSDSEPSVCVSNGTTTLPVFKEEEPSNRYDTSKDPYVLGDTVNIHDLKEDFKSSTCFQSASVNFNDALLHEVQSLKKCLTTRLDDEFKLRHDLFDCTTKTYVPTSLDINSEQPLVNTNLKSVNSNALLPDVIGHYNPECDKVLTHGNNTIIQHVFEPNAIDDHEFDQYGASTCEVNKEIGPEVDVITVKEEKYVQCSKHIEINKGKGSEILSSYSVQAQGNVLTNSSKNSHISEVKTMQKMEPGKYVQDPVDQRRSLNCSVPSETLECSPDSTQTCEDLNLLAPVCEVTLKEVVSFGSEKSALRKNITEKLLYLMTAFTFFQRLTTPLDFVALKNCLSFCTEEMRSALHRLNGDSLSSKLRIFVSQFNAVFCITSGLISRQPNAEDWLRKTLQDTLRDMVEECVMLGQNTLTELCKSLELVLGSIDIPGFGTGGVQPANMKTFIMNNVKSVSILNDTVLLTPKGNSFGVSANQHCLKAIVDYFKECLKSSAIPYDQLSLTLSRNKPELLAALVERKPEAVLALLVKDKSFKCENGLVMMKGFTPVLQETPRQPQSDVCGCCSGIVICVGKSRATFWCSYSQTCKNIFVIARKSQTTINNVLVESFLDVLCEGVKVVFTTKTESENGWTIDFAARVKVVEETVSQTSCLCSKTKKFDVFLQPIAMNNGIPLSNKNTFFWNFRGVLINIKGTKGIVKCMVSDSSDHYFLVYFTKCMWFTGCDILTVNDLAEHLSVGDQVEVDASLLNFRGTGFLTWFATCLRKLSNSLHDTSRVSWNCSGSVVGIESDRFVISADSSVQEGNPLDPKYLFAPFNNIYLTEDGSVHIMLTENMFQLNERIVFDVELDNPHIARFLRKCKRPSVKKPITEEDPSIVVALLKDEMSSRTPVFQNLYERSRTDMLLFNECNAVLRDHLEIDQQRISVESLSYSTESSSNARKGMKDTVCQTVSTGPVFSTLIPV